MSCLDVQHTRFDAAGRVVPMVTGYRGGTVLGAPAPRGETLCADGAGCDLDGWVMVRPYWAPTPSSASAPSTHKPWPPAAPASRAAPR